MQIASYRNLRNFAREITRKGAKKRNKFILFLLFFRIFRGQNFLLFCNRKLELSYCFYNQLREARFLQTVFMKH